MLPIFSHAIVLFNFFYPSCASVYRLPRSTRVFCLRSVNLLRKYSLMFDVPMSFLLSPTAYIASIRDWWTIQKAMSQHASQYVWFRKLYMLFSRYVLVNTYDQLVMEN